MDAKQVKTYKSVVKELNKNEGIVIIAANAFNNIDSQGDVSLKGSFKKTIENIKNIYWYKNHDTYETLGIVKKLWEDDYFLNAELKFNLDKEISRNMYSDYQFFQENGSQVKHSVGVSAVQKEVKDNIMYVKEWKLWEISSLTQWPSNDLAGTHAVKSIEGLKNLEDYYNWMSKKGMHTDDFIRQTENLLKKLQLQKSEPHNALEDKQKEPSNTLDLNYLISKI
jgi:hypothetical protein